MRFRTLKPLQLAATALLALAGAAVPASQALAQGAACVAGRLGLGDEETALENFLYATTKDPAWLIEPERKLREQVQRNYLGLAKRKISPSPREIVALNLQLAVQKLFNDRIIKNQDYVDAISADFRGRFIRKLAQALEGPPADPAELEAYRMYKLLAERMIDLTSESNPAKQMQPVFYQEAGSVDVQEAMRFVTNEVFKEFKSSMDGNAAISNRVRRRVNQYYGANAEELVLVDGEEQLVSVDSLHDAGQWWSFGISPLNSNHLSVSGAPFSSANPPLGELIERAKLYAEVSSRFIASLSAEERRAAPAGSSAPGSEQRRPDQMLSFRWDYNAVLGQLGKLKDVAVSHLDRITESYEKLYPSRNGADSDVLKAMFEGEPGHRVPGPDLMELLRKLRAEHPAAFMAALKAVRTLQADELTPGVSATNGRRPGDREMSKVELDRFHAASVELQAALGDRFGVEAFPLESKKLTPQERAKLVEQGALTRARLADMLIETYAAVDMFSVSPSGGTKPPPFEPDGTLAVLAIDHANQGGKNAVEVAKALRSSKSAAEAVVGMQQAVDRATRHLDLARKAIREAIRRMAATGRHPEFAGADAPGRTRSSGDDDTILLTRLRNGGPGEPSQFAEFIDTLAQVAREMSVPPNAMRLTYVPPELAKQFHKVNETATNLEKAVRKKMAASFQPLKSAMIGVEMRPPQPGSEFARNEPVLHVATPGFGDRADMVALRSEIGRTFTKLGEAARAGESPLKTQDLTEAEHRRYAESILRRETDDKTRTLTDGQAQALWETHTDSLAQGGALVKDLKLLNSGLSPGDIRILVEKKVLGDRRIASSPITTGPSEGGGGAKASRETRERNGYATDDSEAARKPAWEDRSPRSGKGYYATYDSERRGWVVKLKPGGGRTIDGKYELLFNRPQLVEKFGFKLLSKVPPSFLIPDVSTLNRIQRELGRDWRYVAMKGNFAKPEDLIRYYARGEIPLADDPKFFFHDRLQHYMTIALDDSVMSVVARHSRSVLSALDHVRRLIEEQKAHPALSAYDAKDLEALKKQLEGRANEIALAVDGATSTMGVHNDKFAGSIKTLLLHGDDAGPLIASVLGSRPVEQQTALRQEIAHRMQAPFEGVSGQLKGDAALTAFASGYAAKIERMIAGDFSEGPRPVLADNSSGATAAMPKPVAEFVRALEDGDGALFTVPQLADGAKPGSSGAKASREAAPTTDTNRKSSATVDREAFDELAAYDSSPTGRGRAILESAWHELRRNQGLSPTQERFLEALAEKPGQTGSLARKLEQRLAGGAYTAEEIRHSLRDLAVFARHALPTENELLPSGSIDKAKSALTGVAEDWLPPTAADYKPRIRSSIAEYAPRLAKEYRQTLARVRAGAGAAQSTGAKPMTSHEITRQAADETSADHALHWVKEFVIDNLEATIKRLSGSASPTDQQALAAARLVSRFAEERVAAGKLSYTELLALARDSSLAQQWGNEPASIREVRTAAGGDATGSLRYEIDLGETYLSALQHLAIIPSAGLITIPMMNELLAAGGYPIGLLRDGEGIYYDGATAKRDSRRFTLHDEAHLGELLELLQAHPESLSHLSETWSRMQRLNAKRRQQVEAPQADRELALREGVWNYFVHERPTDLLRRLYLSPRRPGSRREPRGPGLAGDFTQPSDFASGLDGIHDPRPVESTYSESIVTTSEAEAATRFFQNELLVGVVPRVRTLVAVDRAERWDSWVKEGKIPPGLARGPAGETTAQLAVRARKLFEILDLPETASFHKNVSKHDFLFFDKVHARIFEDLLKIREHVLERSDHTLTEGLYQQALRLLVHSGSHYLTVDQADAFIRAGIAVPIAPEGKLSAALEPKAVLAIAQTAKEAAARPGTGAKASREAAAKEASSGWSDVAELIRGISTSDEDNQKRPISRKFAAGYVSKQAGIETTTTASLHGGELAIHVRIDRVLSSANPEDAATVLRQLIQVVATSVKERSRTEASPIKRISFGVDGNFTPAIDMELDKIGFMGELSLDEGVDVAPPRAPTLLERVKNSVFGSGSKSVSRSAAASKEYLDRFEEEFGATLKIESSPKNGRTGSYKVVDQEGNVYSKLIFVGSESGRGLTQTAARTRKGWRKKGLSATLFARLLADHPYLEFVGPKELIGPVDERAYNAAIEAGMSPLQAVYETPTYKTLAKMGFSEIDLAQSRLSTNPREPAVVTFKKPGTVLEGRKWYAETPEHKRFDFGKKELKTFDYVLENASGSPEIKRMEPNWSTVYRGESLGGQMSETDALRMFKIRSGQLFSTGVFTGQGNRFLWSHTDSTTRNPTSFVSTSHEFNAPVYGGGGLKFALGNQAYGEYGIVLVMSGGLVGVDSTSALQSRVAVGSQGGNTWAAEHEFTVEGVPARLIKEVILVKRTNHIGEDRIKFVEVARIKNVPESDRPGYQPFAVGDVKSAMNPKLYREQPIFIPPKVEKAILADARSQGLMNGDERVHMAARRFMIDLPAFDDGGRHPLEIMESHPLLAKDATPGMDRIHASFDEAASSKLSAYASHGSLRAHAIMEAAWHLLRTEREVPPSQTRFGKILHDEQLRDAIVQHLLDRLSGQGDLLARLPQLSTTPP